MAKEIVRSGRNEEDQEEEEEADVEKLKLAEEIERQMVQLFKYVLVLLETYLAATGDKIRFKQFDSSF